jgi:dienelactone hydrolase
MSCTKRSFVWIAKKGQLTLFLINPHDGGNVRVSFIMSVRINTRGNAPLALAITLSLMRLLSSMVMLAATACAGAANHVTSGPADSGPAFAIVGDPESPTGATWTFHGRVAGVTYDLAGVLLKPRGPGPFPAVVLSHGSDGSAAFFSSLVAPTMVQWGLVCIATNYTHSSGVPIGSPGSARELGASQTNVLRAHMTRDLLAKLGYVDMSRIALHGHSMGAYLDVAVAGAYPNDFRVASQTGGGVRPDFVVAGPAPSPSQARGIRIPFQLHHGSIDETVPLSYDERFDALLAAQGVEHQLYVYRGEGHLQSRLDPLMLERVRSWYRSHGMF